jgi:hypothetical protein
MKQDARKNLHRRNRQKKAPRHEKVHSGEEIKGKWQRKNRKLGKPVPSGPLRRTTLCVSGCSIFLPLNFEPASAHDVLNEASA